MPECSKTHLQQSTISKFSGGGEGREGREREGRKGEGSLLLREGEGRKWGKRGRGGEGKGKERGGGKGKGKYLPDQCQTASGAPVLLLLGSWDWDIT